VSVGKLKVCANGHRFFKSNDCPICPICEKERKPNQGFLSFFAAPARRALERAGINSIQKVSKFSQHDIASLHGIGPNAIKKIMKLLKDAGLTFKKD
jgi:hypothetical protein